jgi:hypothetical protein
MLEHQRPRSTRTVVYARPRRSSLDLPDPRADDKSLLATFNKQTECQAKQIRYSTSDNSRLLRELWKHWSMPAKKLRPLSPGTSPVIGRSLSKRRRGKRAFRERRLPDSIRLSAEKWGEDLVDHRSRPISNHDSASRGILMKTHDYIVKQDPHRKSVWNVVRRYDSSEEIIETCYSKAEADRIAAILNKALKMLREEFEKLKDEEKENSEQ